MVKLIVFEGSAENLWSWYEVKFLSESLLMAIDASLGHALLVMEFSPIPDLHIMWLLHLCEAHQEMQSWAEAAQCVVTVADVVMQVAIFGGSNINLSAWKDMNNTGWKFYNLAIDFMMDTPLENSPFLESFT
ncbi:hypothetical protein CQW23_14215 [Capsicum baccatum]|uniref:DOCKER Lobe A domain-containing protein n=1 Tax=Capsicum baccatum TaxID=33114 RepID=A0A2G2WII6_CAPBA|nr:hypothetical protein CQW23_14215 [Capsicum baccatum]